MSPNHSYMCCAFRFLTQLISSPHIYIYLTKLRVQIFICYSCTAYMYLPSATAKTPGYWYSHILAATWLPSKFSRSKIASIKLSAVLHAKLSTWHTLFIGPVTCMPHIYRHVYTVNSLLPGLGRQVLYIHFVAGSSQCFLPVEQTKRAICGLWPLNCHLIMHTASWDLIISLGSQSAGHGPMILYWVTHFLHVHGCICSRHQYKIIQLLILLEGGGELRYMYVPSL